MQHDQKSWPDFLVHPVDSVTAAAAAAILLSG